MTGSIPSQIQKEVLVLIQEYQLEDQLRSQFMMEMSDCNDKENLYRIIKNIFGVRDAKTILPRLQKLIKAQSKTDQIFYRYDIKDEQFQQKIRNCLTKEELMSICQLKIGQKGKNMALQLLPFIQKDASKQDILNRKLQELKLSSCQIEKVMKLFKKGKVNPFKRCLIDSFGTVSGNIIFKEFEQFIQVKKNLPEPQSQYLITDKKSGHKIYQYKPNSKTLNTQRKRILVVGQTGCGKSTFLNALVNYLMDVEMDDEFRYKIIIQKADDQTKSITQQISTYKINCASRPYDLQLIDTPGFADTSGLKKDEDIVKKIHCLFTEKIDSLHAVCFVIKSSMFRMNATTDYIFQKVLQLFGKDVAKNFVFVFTFSDGGQVLAIQAVKSVFKEDIQKIKRDPFIKINNSAIFEKVDKDIEPWWKIGMTCFDNLMARLDILEPCSLFHSKKVLNFRERIQNNLMLLRNQFDKQLMKRNHIQKELCTILQYVDQINANAFFKVQVDQEFSKRVPTSDSTTYCQNCNFTCHPKCIFGPGQPKQNCIAMNQGKCTVCPKKCVHTIHINVPYIIIWSTRKKSITHDELKKKYNLAIEGKTNAQKIIKGCYNQLNQSIDQTIRMANEVHEKFKELQQIALVKENPMTIKKYIQLQIFSQEKECKPGFEIRINAMKSLIIEMQLRDKIQKKMANIQDAKQLRLNELLDGLDKAKRKVLQRYLQ